MAIGRCFFFYFSLVNHVAEERVGHPQKCMELHLRYVRARQSHTGRCRDTPLSPAPLTGMCAAVAQSLTAQQWRAYVTWGPRSALTTTAAEFLSAESLYYG
jgi:hypothetical protein